MRTKRSGASEGIAVRLGGTADAAGGAGALGLSLIETLTAMFVLSVGALGLAGGQSAALAVNRAALHRSEAVAAAVDIIERARANRGANYAVALGAAPPAAPDCVAGACSPAELAAFDLGTWKCAFGAWQTEPACAAAQTVLAGFAPAQPGLPDGDGSVAIGPDGAVLVAVQWQERGAANPARIALRTRL